jgi:hypothetical protein
MSEALRDDACLYFRTAPSGSRFTQNTHLLLTTFRPRDPSYTPTLLKAHFSVSHKLSMDHESAQTSMPAWQG